MDLFVYLEQHAKDILALNSQAIKKVVSASVRIKSSIISRDETEKGERRVLNFGHTFGHAIEIAAGLPHGEAVSIGMMIASNLSCKRGLLTAEEDKRLRMLLNDLSLPTRFDSSTEGVTEAIGKDKKRAGGRIHFVLLNGIGNALVEQIAIEELKETLYA
jgi:3-dehydroquinate synthase